MRGRFEVNEGPSVTDPIEFSLVIHPGARGPINSFLEKLRFDHNRLDLLDCADLNPGCVVKWRAPVAENGKGREFPLKSPIPHATAWTAEEVLFWPEDRSLNEYGYHYVAMFIAGNYARYFPDLWLNDVERSTPLCQAIEHLLELAAWRAPLATLSELSRTYHVTEA